MKPFTKRDIKTIKIDTDPETMQIYMHIELKDGSIYRFFNHVKLK